MIGQNIITLVGKVALISALGIGAMWMDIGIEPADSPCTNDPGSTNCCIHQCIHDSSTGCNGGTRCCTNLCS